MLRVPLEAVVLTVKATFGDGAPADDVLCRALTPPAQASVAAAVSNLKVGALSSCMSMCVVIQVKRRCAVSRAYAARAGLRRRRRLQPEGMPIDVTLVDRQ